ncbi:MAG TPA: LytTR family DNA-binding domain-containing protein [Mucilaginibacter sp.]|jgi:two-component system LytT family response regulator|nr:LytTR family DNA-binding domain-containing protein [Mucilaginibacter sp.]
MSVIKAFIVDDEFQSRNLLIKMLQQYFPEIRVTGQAATVEEGLEGIRKYQPNIVFLDIQMKGETGFDLLSRLQEINFALIFTTAFDKYAIKAFRFNAIDYLLKPIVADELVEAVNKAIQRGRSAQSASKIQVEQLYQDMKNPQKIHDKIAIPTGEGFIVVPVNEIVYCHADSNYTRFYLSDKKCILSSYTLKQYDEILTCQSFFRAHRSYLINLAHVKMYRRGEGGEIVMSNGHEIELSRTHKDEFMHLLNVR